MDNQLRRFLLQLLQHRRKAECDPSSTGFTLTELLVVVIIGSLIVSTLMTLVVELVATEQRESAQTETQREMQLAMDYITSDLRQAVYVYDGRTERKVSGTTPELNSYLDYLPANVKSAKPALAFWKPKPLDPVAEGLPGYKAAGCDSLSATKKKECNNLWLQRRTYSLVIYFQVVNNNDPKWKGQSRIVRYELEKYSEAKSFTRNKGYVDPGELGTGGFDNWPLKGAKNCQTDTTCGELVVPGLPDAAGQLVTLVDFVDLSNRALPKSQPAPTCPGNNATEPEKSKYLMQPRSTNAADAPAFYTCIGNVNFNPPAGETLQLEGAAQDIQIYLRGNAKGRGSVGDKPMSPLQTRLTMRGVIDKSVVVGR